MNDIVSLTCKKCNKESKDKFITIAHKIENDSVNLKLEECIDKGYKPINMCCNEHTVIILLKKEGVT
jgi:hypothetical protein